MRLSTISLLASAALGLFSCAQVTHRPTEVTIVPHGSEIELGEYHFSRIIQEQGGLYNADPALAKYVRVTGERIAGEVHGPDLPFEFAVVNTSTPNAWSLPGGKVAITRGLLSHLRSESELAAILSHEIAHSISGHGTYALQNQPSFPLHYDIREELKAEEDALDYLVAAGYSPQGAVTLNESFLRLSERRQELWWEGRFKSHPPSKERLQYVKELAARHSDDGLIGFQEYHRVTQDLMEQRDAYQALDWGFAALKRGDIVQALDLAEQVVRAIPRESLGLLLLGQARLALDNEVGALRALNLAVKYNQSYYDTYLQRGILYVETGRMRAAAKDLQESLYRHPTCLAHYHLGLLRLQEGNTSLALTHLHEASKDPSNIGRRAKRRLAQLELPAAPSKYIALQARTTEDGQLRITAKNRSPIHVRDLVVSIEDPSGQRQAERLHFPHLIESGAETSMTTPAVPSIERVSLRVESLRVVE